MQILHVLAIVHSVRVHLALTHVLVVEDFVAQLAHGCRKVHDYLYTYRDVVTD